MLAKGAQSSWYETIPARDRQVVDAVAKWLRPVRWQWFVTLTFPWNVRAETADRKLGELINLLERNHRAAVSVIAGKESRSRHDGGPLPWHFHLLLASNVTVSKEAIACLWLGLIRVKGMAAPTRSVACEHALIQPYRPDLRGTQYCLKFLNDQCGDWHLHGLEHWLPRRKGTSRPNHRTLRRERRNGNHP